MKNLPVDTLLTEFGWAIKLTMDMSMYHDNFDCACGSTHWFDESIRIVCQGFWKVIVVCPVDDSYFTVVKVKTFLGVKFIGFSSLAGTKVITPEDSFRMQIIRRAYA